VPLQFLHDSIILISTFLTIIQRYIADLLADIDPRPLLSITPDTTMLEAIRKLCLHHVHRMPVVDVQSGNLLCMLTHKRLLNYLYHFVSTHYADTTASLQFACHSTPSSLSPPAIEDTHLQVVLSLPAPTLTVPEINLVINYLRKLCKNK